MEAWQAPLATALAHVVLRATVAREGGRRQLRSPLEKEFAGHRQPLLAALSQESADAIKLTVDLLV